MLGWTNWAILLVVALALILYGARWDRSAWINWGVIWIGVDAVARSRPELVGTMLQASALFAATGLFVARARRGARAAAGAGSPRGPWRRGRARNVRRGLFIAAVVLQALVLVGWSASLEWELGSATESGSKSSSATRATCCGGDVSVAPVP